MPRPKKPTAPARYAGAVAEGTGGKGDWGRLGPTPICGGYYLQPQGDSQHRRREQSRSHKLGRQLFSQQLVLVEQALPQPFEQLAVPQPLLQLEQALLLGQPQALPHGLDSTGTRRRRLTQISSGTVTFTRLQT